MYHRAFLVLVTRLRSASGAPLLLLTLPPLVLYWFFTSPLGLPTPTALLRTAADCRAVDRVRPCTEEGAEAGAGAEEGAEVGTETADDVDPVRMSLAGFTARTPNLSPLPSPLVSPGSPRMVLSPSAPSSKSSSDTGFDSLVARLSISLSC
jgi:hypothetical protein